MTFESTRGHVQSSCRQTEGDRSIPREGPIVVARASPPSVCLANWETVTVNRHGHLGLKLIGSSTRRSSSKGPKQGHPAVHLV